MTVRQMMMQRTELWRDVSSAYPELAEKARECAVSAWAGCSKFPWFGAMLPHVLGQEPELVWDVILGTVMVELLADPALLDDAVFRDRKYHIIQSAEREVSRTLRSQYVTRDNVPRRIDGVESGESGSYDPDRAANAWFDDTSAIDDSMEDTAHLMFPGLNDLEHAVLCSFAETGSFLVTADVVGITPRRVGIIVERLRNRYGTGDYGLVLSADR